MTKKDALLKCIFDMGGQGTREQINSKIHEYWTLDSTDLEIEKGVGKPLFWHRVASSCQALKDKNGYLDNPKRGIWKITEEGYNYLNENKLAEIGDTEIKEVLKTDNKYEEHISTQNRQLNYLEKDLHPFLSYYVFHHLKCFTKTISHSKSDKKGFGEWVHPDMVGCIFPLNEWKKEVIDFSRAIGNVSIKIISFEIKRELNFNNLRESFFQCVSNSSWANESFLVAAEISDKDDFKNELKRLSTSFGIGIIKLIIKDPDLSETILPASNKENLDWDTINKLTINPDFKGFLDRIQKDISKNEIYREKYDKIYDIEKLKESI